VGGGGGVVIGFSARHELGFRDSGYHEDPTHVPEGSFATTPVEEAAAPLAEVVRKERPDVVVTYPEDGGYPHPDHVMCYEVTMRALELAEEAAAAVAGEPWRVPKVYACHAFPPDRVRALHDAIVARGEESPFEGWMERRADREDWPCDARIDVGDWLERRDRALRAHVSQVDPDGTWFSWPRDIEREVYPWECFTRLRTDVDVDGEEDDLFAGLSDTAERPDDAGER
jgi:mycothiol S-conjugate amidase